MKRITILAVVAFALIVTLVSASKASAGCHGGYCGPRYYGGGYGYGGYGYGFGGHNFRGFDFSVYSIQERLLIVKQFPQLEKQIFPNGIPANGAVGAGVVNGAAPAVGGAAPGPNGAAPAAGVAVPAGGVAPAAGAPAAPGAAPAAAPAPGAVVPPAPSGAAVPAGGAAPAAAAAGTPVAAPVSDALAPILGKWVNTVTTDGKDALTEIELKADGTADVTVDSGLGRVTLNRRFAVEDGNFTLINGEAKQILGSVVSADKDKVVLKKGEVELAFTRPE